MKNLTERAYGAGWSIRNLALGLLLALAFGFPVAAKDIRILAFGDSLTAGYGLEPEKGFVAQLNDWLRANGAANVTVLNGGVSGETTAGGLARIDWALGDPVDAVIVELGANDLLRGLDPGAARSNLDGILAAIEKQDLPVLLAGVPVPPNFGEEYQAAFKAIYPDLATQYDAILYKSFFAGLGKGRSTYEIMGFFQGDGLHPNARGVQTIVADIGPVVLELVERVEDSGSN